MAKSVQSGLNDICKPMNTVDTYYHPPHNSRFEGGGKGIKRSDLLQNAASLTLGSTKLRESLPWQPHKLGGIPRPVNGKFKPLILPIWDQDTNVEIRQNIAKYECYYTASSCVR